jgi:Mrp family chromosome partitioning ATPase
MTIMEALERAKALKQEARRRDSVANAELHAIPSDDSGSRAILHDVVRVDAGRVEPAPEQFAGLARVEFDTAACERNRVLLVDAPASEMAGRAAAAYRLLRSRVQHRSKGRKWSCIGITSAGPGEGKSLTTVNVALSIAREKQRAVYVLDLDMRNPSVLKYLGVQPPQELSAFFAEGVGHEQVLYATAVENLVIAGNVAPAIGASELLASSRLEELLVLIRRRSPDAMILIDLPPVTSTDEALVVAPRLDVIFLVVSEGVTRRDALARALHLLSDFPVEGVIMNRSSENFSGDYYSY